MNTGKMLNTMPPVAKPELDKDEPILTRSIPGFRLGLARGPLAAEFDGLLTRRGETGQVRYLVRGDSTPPTPRRPGSCRAD